MTVATREQIMDALFQRIRSVCGSTFKTYSRRFMTWEAVVQSYQGSRPLMQPALFLYDGVGLGGGTETYDPRSRGTPSVTTLRRTIVVYARMPGGGTPDGPDSTTPGGTVFHPLVEAILPVFDPDTPAENAMTLGRLVSHCWLKGEGLIVTGEIDTTQGQGMLTLPVEIMMYPSQ